MFELFFTLYQRLFTGFCFSTEYGEYLRNRLFQNHSSIIVITIVLNEIVVSFIGLIIVSSISVILVNYRSERPLSVVKDGAKAESGITLAFRPNLR